jgi:hypothetical protein
MWSIRTPTGGTLAHGAKVMGLAKYCTLKNRQHADLVAQKQAPQLMRSLAKNANPLRFESELAGPLA